MVEEKNYLILRDGSKLPQLEKSYKLYLDKLSLLYGASESGKSTIMDEIMVLLKPHIPVVFVIAPTNGANQAYTGKVPSRHIKDGRDLPKLAEWLNKFIIRQKNASEIYKTVNNIDNLRELFDLVCNPDEVNIIKAIIKKAEDGLAFIESSKTLNFAHKKSQRNSIQNERDTMLRKVYKTVIRHNKIKLEEEYKNDKKKNVVLTFLDINPRVLIIFDDCASRFKRLYKLTTAIKEIFYEGRQYFISTIIATQDDKEIESEMRKNSMVSIFTTEQISTTNFTRTSNGYPKHVKQKALECIESVFTQDPSKAEHFQKLVYIPNSNTPFRYTIANLYDDYKLCGDPVWEYNDEIKKAMGGEEHSALKNNPFFDKYG